MDQSYSNDYDASNLEKILSYNQINQINQIDPSERSAAEAVNVKVNVAAHPVSVSLPPANKDQEDKDTTVHTKKPFNTPSPPTSSSNSSSGPNSGPNSKPTDAPSTATEEEKGKKVDVPKAAVVIGSRVHVNYRNRGKFYLGKVKQLLGDDNTSTSTNTNTEEEEGKEGKDGKEGKYAIEYEDGEWEHVSESGIKPLVKVPPPPRPRSYFSFLEHGKQQVQQEQKELLEKEHAEAEARDVITATKEEEWQKQELFIRNREQAVSKAYMSNVPEEQRKKTTRGGMRVLQQVDMERKQYYANISSVGAVGRDGEAMAGESAVVSMASAPSATATAPQGFQNPVFKPSAPNTNIGVIGIIGNIGNTGNNIGGGIGIGGFKNVPTIDSARIEREKFLVDSRKMRERLSRI